MKIRVFESGVTGLPVPAGVSIPESKKIRLEGPQSVIGHKK